MCFYSKWNDRTVFGKGTRLKINYTAFSQLKKESGALMLPNSIKIAEVYPTQDGGSKEVEHNLTSFIFRDDCYSLLQQLVNNA